MVVLKECRNMFWGVTLDGGKRYSQIVESPFHLSMAALEHIPDGGDRSGHVQVMIQHDSAEFLLCTLNHKHLLQQPLDLNFSQGEEVTFFLNGTGIVHLTGSLHEEEDMPFSDDYDDEDVDSGSDAPELQGMDDSDSEGDVDWQPDQIGMKRKAIIKSGKAGKKLKITELSEEDDDYDSSFIDDVHVGTESDEEESRDEEEFEDVDSDDLALMNENKVQNSALQSRKSPKKDEKVPASKVDKGSAKKKQKSPKTEESQEEPADSVVMQNGATDAGEKNKKKKKKKKKKNKQEETQQEPSVSANTTTTATVPKKRTVAGGTVVEDTKLGHGPEAKPGKMVSVYYIGTLAKTNKRFDSCQGGKPFRFRLGTGEVIKGWDTGLIGMKVGGKRKITVPPAQGYGNSRQGPIPPGSTLMFDVELKAVS